MTISTIQQVLQAQIGLELAVLVGSRVDGRAHSESDWDIAIQRKREITMLDNLANTETLRRKLAAALGVGEDLIDLIDLPRAGLGVNWKPTNGKNSMRLDLYLAETAQIASEHSSLKLSRTTHTEV